MSKCFGKDHLTLIIKELGQRYVQSRTFYKPQIYLSVLSAGQMLHSINISCYLEANKTSVMSYNRLILAQVVLSSLN